ncbi:unnamed protein product [Rotaria sordida]|uniref:Uncharacterized protein n=1 Tax=Rotaria sordida TaxID=392033 RepID=A0A814TMG3_9BILA|nr:unnamed protein product [Rotaria sordida]
MDYRKHAISTIRTNQPLRQQQKQHSSVFKCIFECCASYETEKVVRFESKWIGILSLIVKLSLAIGCLYLMFQRDSYQIFDRSPISVVTIKVKQSTNCSNNISIIRNIFNYNCTKSLYDVSDFIIPATENSAVSVTIRMIETEHVLKYCNDTIIKNTQQYSSLYNLSIHKCSHQSRCILPPMYRYNDDDDDDDNDEYENILNEGKLCWFKVLPTYERLNHQALDYILFIKHFVEFTQLGLVRHNLASDVITTDYLNRCEYDPDKYPLCPKFRILKILQMIETNPHEYELMFLHGSLIEIRITWRCNLDRELKYCEPVYEFQRLDIRPYEANPYDPGSNFLTSRHFFLPNGRELHRIHTHIYKLHIIVSVTGEAGRFDLFQTTTSIGSFLGIFGTGSIVCDLIATFITNFKRVKYDN